MIAYGGSTLVSNLIAENLLDELHLFVNPAAIGAGLPVFPNLDANQQLRLADAQGFECGITDLHLEPKRS
jgi:dihydrofolate reductase